MQTKAVESVGAKTRLGSRFSRTSRFLLIGFVLILLMEAFVFNSPFWQANSTSASTYSQLTYVSGLKKTGPHEYTVTGTDSATIRMPENNRTPIKYVQIEPVAPTGASPKSSFAFTLGTNNSPHGTWMTGSQRITYDPAIADTHLLHVGGNNTSVQMTIWADAGSTIPALKIIANPKIPFRISLGRLAAMILLLIFFLLLGPGSQLYQIPLKTASWKQRAPLPLVTVFSVGMVLGIGLLSIFQTKVSISGLSPHGLAGHWIDSDQYPRLADALLHHRLTLDLPVPQSLRDLPNPYDPSSRYDMIAKTGAQVFWDHAFYQGHYYSYFGVVPAILLFLPYQLITGRWLLTPVAVLLMCALSSLLITFLIIQSAKKFFPATASVGMTTLAIVAANISTTIFEKTMVGNFYAVPQATALAFTLAGLLCWVSAKETDSRKSLSKPLLILGSILMAATLGCRPQFILATLLAFPIFWQEITEKREFFSIKGLGNTFSVILPYFFVFAPLLWYNFARFGSFLDFGADYNLTGFDMTHASNPWHGIFSEVFYYFFQPSGITAVFPFVSITDTPFSPWYPNEPMQGGIFFTMPFFLISLLALGLVRKKTSTGIGQDQPRGRSAYVWSVLCLLLGLFLLIFDAHLVGTSTRYFMDFTYMIFAACLCGFFAIDRLREPRLEESGREGSLNAMGLGSLTPAGSLLLMMLVLAVCFAFVIQMLSLFTPGRYTSITAMHPALAARIACWFLFL